MSAIFLVALASIGSFAVDLGRLFNLRTQMQNAVDAAAYAAASELDGEINAQNRAIARARDLLVYQTNYTNDDTQLLGISHLPASAFVFYCSIGSTKYELNPGSCTGSVSASDPNKILAVGDADARYVGITLPDRDIDLFLLPVLNAIGIGVNQTAGVSAYALAGQNRLICNWPPMMICDPGEVNPGPPEIPGAPLTVGQMIKLKQHGSDQWAPGNFGFLEAPDIPGFSGANQSLAAVLADPTLMGCSLPVVTTEPGNKGNFPRRGINTRFGLYKTGNDPFSIFPPAPNVVDYPRDDKLTADPDALFGDGKWNITETPPNPGEVYLSKQNRDDYYTSMHGYDITLLNPDPNGPFIPPAGISRWEYYAAELNGDGGDAWANAPFAGTAKLPVLNPAIIPSLGDGEAACANSNAGGGTKYWLNNDCRNINGAPQSGSPGPPNRRVLALAVVPCIAEGITGKQTVAVNRFSKFFMTEHVQFAGGGSDEKIEIYAEYIGDLSNNDDKYHVIVQLYE